MHDGLNGFDGFDDFDGFDGFDGFHGFDGFGVDAKSCSHLGSKTKYEGLVY